MKFVYNVCFNFNQFILVSIYYATSIILSRETLWFSNKKKQAENKITTKRTTTTTLRMTKKINKREIEWKNQEPKVLEL